MDPLTLCPPDVAADILLRGVEEGSITQADALKAANDVSGAVLLGLRDRLHALEAFGSADVDCDDAFEQALRRSTMTVRGREVPAVKCDCGREMPAARLKYEVLGGMCEVCTGHARAAKPEAPQYETEAWSQGVRL